LIATVWNANLSSAILTCDLVARMVLISYVTIPSYSVLLLVIIIRRVAKNVRECRMSWVAMTTESLTAAVCRDTRYNHSVLLVLSVVLLQLLLYDSVAGHGRLVEPPSRASMWRYGYATKPDFHDNQQWCGGFQVCITSWLFPFPPTDNVEQSVIWRISLWNCSVLYCVPQLFSAINTHEQFLYRTRACWFTFKCLCFACFSQLEPVCLFWC